MPNYSLPLTVTSANSGDLTWCLHGQCYYCPDPGGPLELLSYGHRVTITIEASDELPTRVGAYSATSGEFAIDITSVSVGANATFDFPLADEWIELEFQGPTDFDFNVTIDFDYTPAEGPAVYCEYGTRVQPVQVGLAIVSAAAVELALTAVGAPWLGLAFAAFIGVAFQTDLLCNGNPPSVPSFTSDDFLPGTTIPNPASSGKFFQALQAGLWPLYCECSPGGVGQPAPTPPPGLLPPAKPIGLPDGPGGITCSPEDPCTSINYVINVVNSLAMQISYNNVQNFQITNNLSADIQAGVTVLLSGGTPAGYQLGDEHSDLEEFGEFAIAAGALALCVEVVGATSTMGSSPSHPLSFWTQCHVSYGTAEGFFERKPIRHLNQLLELPSYCTRVGYNAADGLSLTITELLPLGA